MADSTVFVVDDDPAMRQSLQFLMESVGASVETYDTAREFLDSYEPSKPGCLVLDVRMPGMSGLELQERLAAEGVAIPVIVITGFGDAQMAVRALKGGAVDFLEKPFTDQHLLERVNEALERDRKRRAKVAEQAEFEARMARLTTRERQVLDFVVEGKANKIIASELGLSPKTVEVHRSRMMDKMGVTTLAQLLRLVITHRGGPSALRSVN